MSLSLAMITLIVLSSLVCVYIIYSELTASKSFIKSKLGYTNHEKENDDADDDFK